MLTAREARGRLNALTKTDEDDARKRQLHQLEFLEKVILSACEKREHSVQVSIYMPIEIKNLVFQELKNLGYKVQDVLALTNTFKISW